MNRCAFDVRPSDWCNRLGFLAALTGIFAIATQGLGENEKVALSPRPLWTTSRVVGSPEPPPPYTVEPVFTQIAWKNPIFAIREPGSEWLIVVEWPQPIAQPAQSENTSDDEKPGQRLRTGPRSSRARSSGRGTDGALLGTRRPGHLLHGVSSALPRKRPDLCVQ